MAGKGKKTAKIVEPPPVAKPKGKLFGAPLAQDVPKIITASLQHLKENAALEEGLFRISGPQEEVQLLKEKWESGKDIDLKKFSPHTVAGTMKLFLRELPEPLLSYQFYSAFITTDAITNNDSRIASVRKLLSLLPRTNCDILKHVMGHFHSMLEHKAKTKMTSANLAIIIAPNILRCRVESVHQIMRDAPHVQSVIRCMIDDFDALFERPIEPAQRRRTIHDFTGSENRSETSLVSEPPAVTITASTTPPAPAAAAAPKETFKLTLSPSPNPSPMGLLSPRIQEVTVEIAPSVPHELRLVLQRIADRFVDLRTALQKASHSRVLGAIMQELLCCAHVAEGQSMPEGQGEPVQATEVAPADPLAAEAQLLKDMLKHFFVTVHKRVASLARAAAKSEACPPAVALDKLLTAFFAPTPAATEVRSGITFVSLRTVLIRYLEDLAHRMSFLQIELAAPTKNHATLLRSLCTQVTVLKADDIEAKPPLEMLAALQTFVTERQRELFEDTILLSDDAGLQRLWAVSATAVAMRRELVRALDQPMPDASLNAPTPKNESNLYSVRSNAMKLLHRVQHNQLPTLKKELLQTTSEQRSMAIGQIVRSVKAALDEPEAKRDYLKEKVVADTGETVTEDRGRLQTLQEVIGFVFVAVEGALANLHADLDSAAYEATATSQLLTDIEAFLTLNLDPSAVVSPKASKAPSSTLLVHTSETEQLLFLRRAAQQSLEQLQEDLDALRGELESTQAVMLALAISKLGNVLKKIMNGDTVEDSQFVARPQEEDNAESKDREKLEALKKLTFLTFDKAQAFLFKQRSTLQGAKSEMEVNEVTAATSQLHRALEAFK